MLKGSVAAKQRNIFSNLHISAVGKTVSCNREVSHYKTSEPSTKPYITLNVTETSQRGSKSARWVVVHSEKHIPQATDKWVSIEPLALDVDSDIWIHPNLANTGQSPKSTEQRSSFSPLDVQHLPRICWIGRVFRKKKKDEILYKRLCLHLASEGFTGWESGECLRRIIKINSSASDVECSAGTVFTPVALCFQLTWFWSNGCYPKIYINNKYSEKFRFPGPF